MSRGLLAAGAAVLALVSAAPASADLASLKDACQAGDAAPGDRADGLVLPYVFCDDGLPDAGGTEPNERAARAVAVPQRYQGHAGLPAKAPAHPGSGADSNGDVALDVDVTMPDAGRFPPGEEGWPLVVMMHGCCAGSKRSSEATDVDARGEAWRYSNAWFASRGYVVLTYTSRGFVDGQGRGSTGWTELDSRRYEINDYQHLAGQLADDPFFHVDPQRVVATGGSYGGGFSWMALTDPTWTSPGGRDMRLVAAAPKYGWTDLVESLVPNGIEPRATDGSTAASPIGAPKRTIIAGLYVSGKTGLPSVGGSHATFGPEIDAAILCLNTLDPFAGNPLCGSTLANTLPAFVRDRSAYYQDEFFARVREGERVPVFSAGTFTDPLFPTPEHRRMAERLRAEAGGDYPIQEYYGDYQHFTQNKPTEWADLCGDDRHRCHFGEEDVRRVGVTSRLNRFLDHHARPAANRDEAEPRFDVTAALQVCPANESAVTPGEEPGLRFTAPTFDQLAPETLRIELGGERTTTFKALPNPHALGADPLVNQLLNGNRCAVAEDEAGPGVASWDSEPLAGDVTLIGSTRLTLPHTGAGSGVMLAARLYDVFPDGRALLVDRGVRTGVAPEETTVLDLFGAAWRFESGHRIRVEVTQDDEPYLRFSTQPSTLTIDGVTAELPVRPEGPSVRLDAPELASDTGGSRLFGVGIEPASGERTGIDRFELEARNSRRHDWRPIAGTADGDLRFRGFYGRTYELRARAVDHRGVPGPWEQARTVVPLDDRRGTRAVRYSGRWSRPRARNSYGGRISRSTRRGDELRLRFRGRRVWLVGRRSPRGGRAIVTIDGRRHSVSFRARRTRARAVLLDVPVRGGGVHELRLVNVGRGRVEVDALGVLDRRP
ncbi:MAG: CocE/NonD family hydrolase C-terminal non-catalytic domain-containing protein [Thermoleophilaceae bacterium]